MTEDYWTSTHAKNSQRTPDALVSIDLREIVPFDDQFGIHPAATIPDALIDVLRDETLRLFAILDAAKIEGLAEILEGAGLPFKCLYRGALAESLRDVAPYLVELSVDSSLLRQVFTRAKGRHYLWDLGAGVLLQSDAKLDAICAHLRTLTALKDEANKVRYFRFWDASILHKLVAASSTDFPDPLHLFGSEKNACIQAFILPDPINDSVAIARPQAQSPTGRLTFSARLTQVLKAQARDAFALTLITHCAPRFPKTLARLPETEQRDLMLAGIIEARGFGIAKRGPVTSYIEMRLVLGAGMSDDPMYPWVADVLRRVTPQNQMAAMEALVSRFTEYNSKVNGLGNAHFYAALARARAALDASHGGSYAELLRQVYPEKTAVLGTEAVAAFLSDIKGQLASYPNLDENSVRAFVLLCFFMGHRCAEDPQYGWIGPTLLRSAQASGLENPLMRKSKIWSDSILEGAPKQ